MFKKSLALALALMLALGSFAALAEAAAPAAENDPVLATVGEQAIHLSEVDAIIPQLQEYITDPTDYQAALRFLVQNKLIERKAHDMGFDQFTQEEQDAFAKDAQAQWDQWIESYVTYYLSEDTPEAREKLTAQAEEFHQAQGMSLERLVEDVKKGASFDLMSEYLMAGYEPTQEEIDAVFQQFGASYQQNYENNIMAYEYNTIYGQQTSWYTPEGYRGIIHILLQPEAALLDNYARLQSAHEEQQNFVDAEQAVTTAPDVTIAAAQPATPAPTTTPEPVTQAQLDAARQAILDAVKADTDAIYERLAKGEAFEAMIAEYGKDPGMMDEGNLKDGYMVHKDSIVWDNAFTTGAFTEKMQKVGDVSDPVISAHGVHILKYLRDVPAGLLLTETIKQDITDYLMAVHQNQVFSQAIAGWEAEIGVSYNQEAIDQAIQAAQALQQTEQEPTLEALPAAPEAEASEAPAEVTNP